MPHCELTGKKPVVKNLVSHSNIKTKSRAFPNVQIKTFYSPCLKRSFRLKVSTSAVRSIDKTGGIDNFLMKCAKNQLSPQALKLRKSMEKKLRKKPDKSHEQKAKNSIPLKKESEPEGT